MITSQILAAGTARPDERFEGVILEQAGLQQLRRQRIDVDTTAPRLGAQTRRKLGRHMD